MAGMTPLTFQILLALADGDRHGYGIIKEIERRSVPATAPSTGARWLRKGKTAKLDTQWRSTATEFCSGDYP